VNVRLEETVRRWNVTGAPEKTDKFGNVHRAVAVTAVYDSDGHVENISIRYLDRTAVYQMYDGREWSPEVPPVWAHALAQGER
jgi:hypothetical protein